MRNCTEKSEGEFVNKTREIGTSAHAPGLERKNNIVCIIRI